MASDQSRDLRARLADGSAKLRRSSVVDVTTIERQRTPIRSHVALRHGPQDRIVR